ncbi:AgmX/PglI C-terminal domain-containing protein [Anaeromyxobacter oryzisoli]|uniref:AgmX/PglI C-terminal domain-containing protein n=1 Tax=Anaeromyxobacter oryzisoli TaxID=2925408 RepID=UPI001F55DB3D|nr:AgmX/PglI C-terminal domain-containing protein [Anaeromyxobacter sp. SG63]
MAAQQRKVLRVGVIRGGQIVEERVLPANQPVSIGTASTNTIVVPSAKLPASTQVFACRGGQYALLFAEGTQGRIEGGQGSAADLSALVSQGRAKPQGAGLAVPVREDEQGKLVLGDVTVLWQFMAPAAEAPKAVLKSNHFQSMDRLFVSVLVGSFLLHSGVYVALANTELPKEVTLEEIPERFAKVLIPDKLPKPPQAEEKKAEEVTEAKAEAKKQREEKKAAEAPEQTAERKAARAAAVAKAVQSKGILKVLGALGPSTGGGAVADVFGSGGGMGDVASALSGAGGVAVATDPGAGGGRKGGGEGGKASIGALATTGGGSVGYGAKAEVNVKVSGSVQADEAEVDSSEIDQGRLASFVRARMGLIKACYENALKRNPSLKGKVSIRFTILETGGLADISAAVNTLATPEVASCIVGTMRTWRTQFKPSGPVTVEYPFVFSPTN